MVDMGNDFVGVCSGIGAGVFFACIFLATWASSEVKSRLYRIYPAVPNGSGLLSLPPLDRTPLANWTIFHLPAYILSGRYKNSDDPKVRRYGVIARYALIVWCGGVTAFLVFLMGIAIAANM